MVGSVVRFGVHFLFFPSIFRLHHFHFQIVFLLWLPFADLLRPSSPELGRRPQGDCPPFDIIPGPHLLQTRFSQLPSLRITMFNLTQVLYDAPLISVRRHSRQPTVPQVDRASCTQLAPSRRRFSRPLLTLVPSRLFDLSNACSALKIVPLSHRRGYFPRRHPLILSSFRVPRPFQHSKY